MLISVLIDEQQQSYGRFTGELSAEQLARFLYLDDADREVIGRRRWDHTCGSVSPYSLGQSDSLERF
jgi:hypothetical protein